MHKKCVRNLCMYHIVWKRPVLLTVPCSGVTSCTHSIPNKQSTNTGITNHFKSTFLNTVCHINCTDTALAIYPIAIKSPLIYYMYIDLHTQLNTSSF